jgi:anhydro-N-acetylmuramic acid kinase
VRGERAGKILAGVMAGTSADGLDVALVSVGSGREWELLGFEHFGFGKGLRERVLAVAGGSGNAEAIAKLSVDLGRRIGLGVLAACRRHRVRVEAVASHGQTIFHQGRRASLQIGDAATIAAVTGRPVISDFRSADIAQGGEGAPLVPWADWRLFGHAREWRVALNLGGIANLTFLPPGRTPAGVWGYDTGPGNMACDTLKQQISCGRQSYDRNGVMALRGVADEAVLRALLQDSYFRRRAPKSCGREQFGADYVGGLRRRWPRLQGEDLMATLVELTAETVTRGLKAAPPCTVMVAGGGWRNRALREALRRRASGYSFMSSDDFGVPTQAREAMAFALLGAARLRGEPANLPRVTGARRAVVLGSLTAAPPGVASYYSTCLQSR